MSLSFQQLLLLAAVAFYLGDSMLLLYADEMALSVAQRRWQCGCPAGDWRLSGRIPFLPNPLTPHRALFRARFAAPLPTGDQAGSLRLEAQAQALRWLAVPVLLVALWLFGVLPVVAWRAGMGQHFLLAAAAGYAWILALVLLVAWRRQSLGLSARAVAALAFDVLACPPFALNLVRKISLRMPVQADAVALARARLTSAGQALLAAQLDQRLALLVAAEPEASPRARQLEDYRRDLAALAA